MRSFRGLSDEYTRTLLAPFKTKQLLAHILSSVTEDQLRGAESLLQERMIGAIDAHRFTALLDLPAESGGAGWNRIRAVSLAGRIEAYLDTATRVKTAKSAQEGARLIYAFFADRLTFPADSVQADRVREALTERLALKIDLRGLQQKLDDPVSEGGAGLRRDTAEHLVSETETILLLKY
ncbi:MAG: hypothetical protein WCJ25_05395 [Candidatus Moraniibacteriota bacterium]